MISIQLATHIMFVYTIKAGHCRRACNVRENTFIYGIDNEHGSLVVAV